MKALCPVETPVKPITLHGIKHNVLIKHNISKNLSKTQRLLSQEKRCAQSLGFTEKGLLYVPMKKTFLV
jgi:hypothetical protein